MSMLLANRLLDACLIHASLKHFGTNAVTVKALNAIVINSIHQTPVVQLENAITATK